MALKTPHKWLQDLKKNVGLTACACYFVFLFWTATLRCQGQIVLPVCNVLFAKNSEHQLAFEK